MGRKARRSFTNYCCNYAEGAAPLHNRNFIAASTSSWHQSSHAEALRPGGETSVSGIEMLTVSALIEE